MTRPGEGSSDGGFMKKATGRISRFFQRESLKESPKKEAALAHLRDFDIEADVEKYLNLQFREGKDITLDRLIGDPQLLYSFFQRFHQACSQEYSALFVALTEILGTALQSDPQTFYELFRQGRLLHEVVRSKSKVSNFRFLEPSLKRLRSFFSQPRNPFAHTFRSFEGQNQYMVDFLLRMFSQHCSQFFSEYENPAKRLHQPSLRTVKDQFLEDFGIGNTRSALQMLFLQGSQQGSRTGQLRIPAANPIVSTLRRIDGVSTPRTDRFDEIYRALFPDGVHLTAAFNAEDYVASQAMFFRRKVEQQLEGAEEVREKSVLECLSFEDLNAIVVSLDKIIPCFSRVTLERILRFLSCRDRFESSALPQRGLQLVTTVFFKDFPHMRLRNFSQEFITKSDLDYLATEIANAVAGYGEVAQEIPQLCNRLFPEIEDEFLFVGHTPLLFERLMPLYQFYAEQNQLSLVDQVILQFIEALLAFLERNMDAYQHSMEDLRQTCETFVQHYDDPNHFTEPLRSLWDAAGFSAAALFADYGDFQIPDPMRQGLLERIRATYGLWFQRTVEFRLFLFSMAILHDPRLEDWYDEGNVFSAQNDKLARYESLDSTSPHSFKILVGDSVVLLPGIRPVQ